MTTQPATGHRDVIARAIGRQSAKRYAAMSEGHPARSWDELPESIRQEHINDADAVLSALANSGAVVLDAEVIRRVVDREREDRTMIIGPGMSDDDMDAILAALGEG